MTFSGPVDLVIDNHRSGVANLEQRALLRGGTFAFPATTTLIDPSLSRRVVDRISERHQADPRLASLSARERDILLLMAEGLTHREIGQRLSLAEGPWTLWRSRPTA